jgi:hypothetical protein
VSSSGLIYAVIVGAWAAYLVPMWLRRQDELNESRPTERFSTAIRLLAGRSALERRASRALGDDDPTDTDTGADTGTGADADGSAAAPSVLPAAAGEPGRAVQPDRRARLLARRRRMVTLLFGAFALGAVTAAVAGVTFLWVPAVPAMLLTLYIGHLRRLERQRFEVKLDRARAVAAAQRVREREGARAAAAAMGVPPAEGWGRVREREGARAAAAAVGVPPAEVPQASTGGTLAGRAWAGLADTAPLSEADVATEPFEPSAVALVTAEVDRLRPEPATPSRQDLVEATDHEEWVDGLRERAAAGPDSWEPVPVPLPTYVTAPVAPRVNRGLDLAAPAAWAPRPGAAARPAEAPRTPLFDQYQESAPHARPRAANE